MFDLQIFQTVKSWENAVVKTLQNIETKAPGKIKRWKK